MALSHKHLNIKSDEWQQFMQVFYEVCNEFHLPEGIQDDLKAILESTEPDCVVHEGETAPENPGPQAYGKGTLYERLGGVYPIALFVDRLVDALLQDKRVKLPVDGQKRNEATLKYLFTELVCHAAGGPEVVTSETSDETKLLLQPRKMFFLLDGAKEASNHFLSNDDRIELIELLASLESKIVDPKKVKELTDELRTRQKKVFDLGRKS